MDRQQAEKMITEYVKPLFGFALKRCKTPEDAEDLSQEIVLRAFRALLAKEDIADVGKYVWTIAHNTLNNYYRDSARSVVGVSLDEVAELLADPGTDLLSEDNGGTVQRLQKEIAYLSALQRRIVILYYFENRKQTEIATLLNIPLGTVKWHLFEAKKELKKGMDTMRKTSELKFNPIRFSLCGFNGSVGSGGSPARFFRSALAQNIVYCIREEAKTINEIADDLGVSPVYVEDEVGILEENGFILKNGNRYIIHMLLDTGDAETVRLMDKMYGEAAKVFANDLYDALRADPILQELTLNRIVGVDEERKHPIFEKDENFTLWALIPYIAAQSGERMISKDITFEEAATLRPDGGHNICYATVEGGATLRHADSFFFGPCWNAIKEGPYLWTLDTEWSARRVEEHYQISVGRDLSLLRQFFQDEEISPYDYVYMAEKGYLTRYESEKGQWTGLRVVWIRGREQKDRLLSIGDRIREKHRDLFERLKAPYVREVLRQTPRHLQKMRGYDLQYLCFADGWFLLYCLKELVNNGKLLPPTEEQKASLSTLIITGSQE